ncbi:MAG: hypothetical protein K6D56_00545 [Clostridia bacterium]|nr:hypothetical protein [Clostridia bacterium]
MLNYDGKVNYKLQFKVFGIGLAVAAVAAVVLVVSGVIGWGGAAAIIAAAICFETMYFLILRDSFPGPLTQYAMRKGVKFIDDDGNMIKELKPGMYKISKTIDDYVEPETMPVHDEKDQPQV